MSETRCTVCGTSFEATRSDSVYCSARCRQQAARDRGKSDATVTVGGLVAPCDAFLACAASCDVPSAASISCHLRGEPARDSSTGLVPVQITVAGETLWRGHVERMVRSDSGTTITATCTGSDAPVGPERLLAVRDVSVITYGSPAAAPLAVAVRGLQGVEARRVGTGEVGVLCRLTCLHPTQSAVEVLADRFAALVAAGIVVVEAACDASVTPGERVRIEHEAVRDLVLTVTHVRHSFAGGVLTTRLSALHLPPPPVIPEARAVGVASLVIGALSANLHSTAHAGGLAA